MMDSKRESKSPSKSRSGKMVSGLRAARGSAPSSVLSPTDTRSIALVLKEFSTPAG